MPKPTAIGYLRRDISGAQQLWDETQIRSVARRLGYELAKTVVFDARTEQRASRLQVVLEGAAAEAVITPGLAHLDGDPEQLVRLCDVITVSPENTYARWAVSGDA